MAEGITSKYNIDPETGAFTRYDTQDAEPIIDANTIERNSGENENRFSNMRKVASIPLVTVEALKTRSMKDGGPIDIYLVGVDPDHTVRFYRWLDDRDNRKFRTSEARMGDGYRKLF